jgi:hypothetical protein
MEKRVVFEETGQGSEFFQGNYYKSGVICIII